MPRLRFRLLALTTFLLVFPFFLRRRPRVERRITILAPPEVIFPLLNDLRKWPHWTSWGEDKEIDYFYGESSSGEGALQRWRKPGMDGSIRITRSEANQRLDYETEMQAGKYQIRGRIDLGHDGACTRVTWRCVWEPAANPYLRYMDLFCRWMVGRDFSRGLAKLKRLVESRPA